VLLILVFLVMVGLNALHVGLPDDVGARAALVFGFLLITGFILGEMLTRLAVPRITGYLLAGMICGPSLLELVDQPVIDHLRLVDDLALIMIAFTAGAELTLGRLRSRLKSIGSITVSQTVMVFLAVTAVFWALRPVIGVLESLDGAQYLGVAAILGVIATATSPSTAVAVILEARSRGPVTDTVLGCTVLKDILVLVGFSLVMALSLPGFTAGPGMEVTPAGWILLEAALSLVIGFVFGLLMILYLRFVGRERVLFVVAAAFVIIVISRTFSLDHLLVAVAAGFTVSNLGAQGGGFLTGLERASAPVFLIFFCLAGASLNLSVLGSLWHLALLFVLSRAVFTWAGTWAGAAIAGDPAPVKKSAWTGFIGQAGVSLGLATLARRAFPEVGGMIADLIVGAIVFNQLVGPIWFRFTLLKTGEGCKD